jgi:hypothetical protein
VSSGFVHHEHLHHERTLLEDEQKACGILSTTGIVTQDLPEDEKRKLLQSSHSEETSDMLRKNQEINKFLPFVAGKR